MALVDNAWYIDDGDNSTTGWWAITAWSNNGGAGTAYTAGQLIRQSGTPTVGNERMYVCVVAGTGGTGADPLTTFTRGVKIASGSATFQECTGIAALNGDATDTPSWTITATPPGGVKGTVVTLGQVIKRDNGVSYQICTTGGTAGSGAEPAFSDTAGVTTNDNTVVWTSLGAVGGFSIFGCPHARMASAFTATWGQAGNSFFIKSTSAETQASSMTLTSPGTTASPCNIYSVGTGAVPPTSTTAGASIAVTGGNNLTIAGAGSSYWAGISFLAGSAALGANLAMSFGAAAYARFDSCTFRLVTTAASSQILLGTAGLAAATPMRTVFNSHTLTFAAVGQSFAHRGGDVLWNGGSITGANLTTVFANLSGAPGQMVATGVDFSVSTGTLVGAIAQRQDYIFQDCTTGSGATIAATPTSMGGAETYLVRSDSSGTNYRHEKYSYAGRQTVETTIVRTGGASDGTTPISWKVVPTANSKWSAPFECIPITIWNDTISPTTFTVTIYGIWSGGAVPTNADVWADVEYLGSAASPLGSVQSGTKASNLASATPQTADASVWGGSTTAFKMVSASITAAQKGWINIYVKVGASSGTIYIDPKPVVT